MAALSRRAPAKINLALSVGPPGPGGMHPIASWMCAIDLHDDVSIKRSGARPSVPRVVRAADAPVAFEIDWPPERDLAVRAHRALEGRIGRELPAAIEVRKRIPPGGGLGGGSSDAAAVLLGLNELFGLKVPLEELADLSRGLGSDVAFFLDEGPRAAFVAGLGDRIERTPRITGELVLVLPPFGCATAAVYRAYDAAGPPREADVRHMSEAGRLSGLFNDLEEAAERVEPRLGALRREAERGTGVRLHLSGSGSTLFAAAGPGEGADGGAGMARKLAGNLSARWPGTVVLTARQA